MGPWSWRMMSFRVDFGARCAFSGSFLVRGAPFLGLILVRGVWCADFGADFGAQRAVFLGSILVRGVWCADFGADFGARCAFLGSILVRGVRRFWARFWCAVRGAPILGSILVRGAPFLGSILVRGVWCADFGADFGARCAFWVRFWCAVCGAPIVVLIFWARFW